MYNKIIFSIFCFFKSKYTYENYYFGYFVLQYVLFTRGFGNFVIKKKKETKFYRLLLTHEFGNFVIKKKNKILPFIRAICVFVLFP